MGRADGADVLLMGKIGKKKTRHGSHMERASIDNIHSDVSNIWERHSHGSVTLQTYQARWLEEKPTVGAGQNNNHWSETSSTRHDLTLSQRQIGIETTSVQKCWRHSRYAHSPYAEVMHSDLHACIKSINACEDACKNACKNDNMNHVWMQVWMHVWIWKN